MDRDSSLSVEHHFHEALGLGGAGRAAYVANLATLSPEVAEELRSLLEHAQDGALTGSFDSLQSLASELGIGRVAVGQDVGGYRLVEMIGEGGSGRVFRAIQRSPQREVALKVLRTGLDEARGRVLFEVEAATLARLGHPSIGHVYASGVLQLEGRSVPWFAMELVEGGVPITKYVDQKGGPVEQGVEQGVEQRVELFAAVAEAVAYAHGRGVVHLDLTPRNVLVDRHGTPKVIDFGIAQRVKAQDANGQPVGTPGYMSPEQCEGGAVDARSDVWALGVLLGELVDVTGAARGAELQAVVRRATEPDPDRRYRDAAALAEDLRHWLARRPLRALPQSPTYLARCFVRRNPLASVALVLLALALVAVYASTAWGLSRAERSRADAEWGVSFFRTWLEDADPLTGNGPEATFGTALAKASTQLDSNPPPRALEADLRHSLGVALQDAGLPREAMRHLERALALRIQDGGVDAEATLRTEQEFAYVYQALGEYRSAYEHSRRVAASRAASHGANHREALTSEMAALRAASALDELGADALARTQELVARCVEHLGAEDDDTITARQNLGVALHAAGWSAEAAMQFRMVADWRIRVLGADDLRTHMAHRDLGAMLMGLGRLGEASRALERAADGLETCLGRDHPVTLTALANLAVARRRAGELDAAIELTARVADDRARVLGAYHPHTLESLLNLSTALLDASLEVEGERGRSLHDRAKQRLVELEEQRGQLSQRGRTALDANVGKAMAAEGRWAEAAAAFGRARDNAASGEGTWIDAYLEGRYVHARSRADGRHPLDAEAREQLERCIRTLKRLRGPGDRYTAALEDLLPR